jgi:hypothetical protein
MRTVGISTPFLYRFIVREPRERFLGFNPFVVNLIVGTRVAS